MSSSSLPCPQCHSLVASGELVCRNCGTVQPEQARMIRKRATNGNGSGTENELPPDQHDHALVDAQRIQVEPSQQTSATNRTAPPADDTSMLTVLTEMPPQRRKELLRVSPFVFFIIPTILFYLSSVLASYTLHFGESGLCTDSLRSFLWGAIIIGYWFVLGFAWMIVGPRVDSLAWKWSGILLYTVLLGVLTAMGARRLLDTDNTIACTSSAWFKTCWVITCFYCLFWLVLACIASYEVVKAMCFPSPARIIILGVGAGMNKLHLKTAWKEGLHDVFEKFPKFPQSKKKTNQQKGDIEEKKQDGRSQGEIELEEIEQRILNGGKQQDMSEDIRKDNFFGSQAKEKRRSLEKEKEKDGGDESKRPPLNKLKSTSSVAPSPQESDADDADEPDTPTQRRRKRERAAREAETAKAEEEISFFGASRKKDQEQSERPVSSNKVADSHNIGGVRARGEEDDLQLEEDPFQAKIAANKREQAARRKEIEELARAQAAMKPAQPTAHTEGLSTPQLFAAIDPSTPAAGQPQGPVSILRPTTANGNAAGGGGGDRFKMVEWETSSRLEAVKQIEEPEGGYDVSFSGSSSAGGAGGGGFMTDRSDFNDPYADRRAPPKYLPPMQNMPQPPPFDPSGQPIYPASSPLNLARAPFDPSGQPVYPSSSPMNQAYSYGHIASPSASPSPGPLPSQSTMVPAGPVYPAANDPNRFSKLMAMRQGQQPQQVGQRWPPPPPPLPSSQQQANPIRYHTIMDDDDI